jgi:tetratricopeptide (TPR) repeat protein
MSGIAAPAPDDREMELFELAAAATADERETILLSACPDSEQLRNRVREMLDWEQRMAGFLEKPFFSVSKADDPFVPGSVVAGRFEVRREIAEGGMSRVYEAVDLMLGQKIALKVPGLAYRKRLVGELRNAIQVTHPNICRVHEVHSGTANDGHPVDFLTMEYLDGVTLASRLAAGRLPVRDVRVIAEQICAGLAEAHAHDIVHGDLKPNNVILASNGQAGSRAVITDFGLAQALAPDMPASPFGASLRGAADYIAPERWQGQRSSKATDVYALGVILFTMLTGRTPGRTNTIDFKPAPRGWRKLLRKCLAPQPECRPANASAVLAALPQDRTKLAVAAALVLCFSAAGIAGWQTLNAPVIPEAVRLAILTADTDAPSSVVANGVALDISERLARTEGPVRPVVVIPFEKSIRYHAGSAESADRVLGATHALSMRWRSKGERFEVDVEIADARARRNLETFRRIYDRAGLNEIVRTTVNAGASAFHRGMTGGQVPAAYADYAEGLYYLRQAQDAPRAKAVFEGLAKTAADDLWIGLRLAQADVGEYQLSRSAEQLARARGAIDRVAARAKEQPDTALVLASLEEGSGRLEAALELYTKLGTDGTRQGPASRAAAGLLQRLGRPGEAERAWNRAIGAEPGYFQPHMDLGVFYFNRGDYPAARDRFAYVTNVAPGLAIPHYDLAAALVDLGEYARAEQEYQRALSIEEDPDTLTGIGALLAYRNRDGESVAYYERAVASGPEDPLTLSNLADSYRRTGRLSLAADVYHRVLAVAERRMANRPGGDAFARAIRAWALANLGRRREAQREIRIALQAGDQVKVRKRAVLVWNALGMQEEAFLLLRGAPQTLLTELVQYPDLSLFTASSRFKDISSASKRKD